MRFQPGDFVWIRPTSGDPRATMLAGVVVGVVDGRYILQIRGLRHPEPFEDDDLIPRVRPLSDWD